MSEVRVNQMVRYCGSIQGLPCSLFVVIGKNENGSLRLCEPGDHMPRRVLDYVRPASVSCYLKKLPIVKE